jgi:uncharacterized membrane protein
MLDWLKGIWEAVTAAGQLVLWALVSFVNLLISAIGAAIGAFFSLLPGMPAEPSGPGEGVLGWLVWIIPVGPLVAGLATFVGIWLIFLAVRIPLRWLKVL